MSLYSHDFQLLPRPQRSLFSIGSDVTRAVLPDFDNVAQLSQFTHRILHWQPSLPGMYVQAKVGASFVCLLVVVVAMILARRTYERSLWFVRIIKRPAGGILVPNSILIFSLVEGFFGVTFVAFLWELASFFETAYGTPTNFMLWLLLPWIPLIYGAIWAAWGTYFATPNALQSSIDGSGRNFLKRMVLRPYVANLTGLLLPLAITISVLVPAILSNVHWQRALKMEQDWQAVYANQTTFTEEMVQASQAVWYETLRGTKKASITFVIWIIHAFWVALAYTGISWGLISAIRSELGKQKNLHDDGLSGVAKTTVYEGNVEQQSEVIQPVEGNHLFTQAEMEANAPVESFFPPVRPHHVVGNRTEAATRSAVGARDTDKQTGAQQMGGAASSDPPAKSQRSYLKGALIHIYIQTCAISPACLAFAGVALLLCLTVYGKLEQADASGGTQVEYYFSVAIITVVWTTCLFGGITLVAIAHRTYEPVISSTHLLLHRANTDQNSVAFPPRAKGANNHRHITSSFFETRSQNHPLSSARAARSKRGLDNVEEGTELPDMSSQGHLLIERTVETYEERKRGATHRSADSSYSDGDDDDFFKGGSGRRTRTLSSK